MYLRSIRTTLLVALMSLGFGIAVEAQPDPERAASVERLEALFARLAPTENVLVVTPQIYIEGATVLAVDAGILQLADGARNLPIPLRDIRAVSVRSHHPIQGMLMGLGSGLLVGGVGGMLIGSFDCQSPEGCRSDERNGAILWGSVLGVLGGVTGFMVGRHSVSWRPVFP